MSELFDQAWAEWEKERDPYLQGYEDFLRQHFGLPTDTREQKLSENFDLWKEWQEDLHPRVPAGSPGGGEFTSGGEAPLTDSEHVSPEFRATIEKAFKSLPQAVKDRVKTNGTQIALVPTITGFGSGGHLNVAGQYIWAENRIEIAERVTGTDKDGKVDLFDQMPDEHSLTLYHELGHSLDDSHEGWRNSDFPEWRQAHRLDVKTMNPISKRVFDYYLSPTECFAQMFAMSIHTPEQRGPLGQKFTTEFPRSYQIMQRVVKSL